MLDAQYNRQAQRRAVDLPCTIIGPSWDEPLTYRMTDLSPGGAWVRTSFPLKVGQHVVVAFRPPPPPRGARPTLPSEFTVFARVTRAERPLQGVARGSQVGGMGLEFCDFGREERVGLQRCLSHLPVRDRRVTEQLCAPPPPPPWRDVRGRW
jgi:hypothetical protein